MNGCRRLTFAVRGWVLGMPRTLALQSRSTGGSVCNHPDVTTQSCLQSSTLSACQLVALVKANISLHKQVMQDRIFYCHTHAHKGIPVMPQLLALGTLARLRVDHYKAGPGVNTPEASPGVNIPEARPGVYRPGQGAAIKYSRRCRRSMQTRMAPLPQYKLGPADRAHAAMI